MYHLKGVLMHFIPQALKAFYAAAVAVLGGLAAVLVGDVGFTDLTTGQWVTIVFAGLIAFGGVYGLKNAPSDK